MLARNEWLRSPHEGIFLCRVKPGDNVAEGQVLGELIDLVGNHLANVISPADGMILFTVTSPAIKKDGPYFKISRRINRPSIRVWLI